MKPNVLVIDYRTGNSQSVSYALTNLGITNHVAQHPDQVGDVTHIILPGVGAAGTTMEYLASGEWLDFLNNRVLLQGLPFLGVCVGLQVLFDRSDEQNAKCLGWLPGNVAAFDRQAVRVPHMGWNRVVRTGNHPFAAAISADSYFYFVNSYFAKPREMADVAGTADYDGVFAAVIARKNIMATQFHIEKSGPSGLALLSRFTTLTPRELQ
ncbi:MAG TPA: imidazole glycerol phosphate synthase subunit HisH [Thermomicrobiales bacterium]|nr:imidazole glycerol phosphate synthase subunit HisH [Thermomicrobiales bacterium]